MTTETCWACGDSLTRCDCDESRMRAIDWSPLDEPLKLTPYIPFASCLCGETIHLRRGRRFVDAHVKAERCRSCTPNVLAAIKQEKYV